MDEKIFSGTAHVEFQGPRVLRFIELSKDAAEFEVIGLNKPQIHVIDKRPAVKRSMSHILKTGKVEELIWYFNKPAKVTILPPVGKKGKMTISLEKTRAKNPHHMLWVSIGMGNELPIYDYLYKQVRPFSGEQYALCSLYRRPARIKS